MVEEQFIDRREVRPHWVQRGQYAVQVQVEQIYLIDDPHTPCLEPKTIRHLDAVAERAEAGDMAYLRKVGRVFSAVDAAKVPA